MLYTTYVSVVIAYKQLAVSGRPRHSKHPDASMSALQFSFFINYGGHPRDAYIAVMNPNLVS